MGLLVEGKWVDRWYDTKKSGGRFVRSASRFRDWVTREPDATFPAEAGRYHLYVADACPWAHRTLIVRSLLGLTDQISVSVVHPDMLDEGWSFADDHPDHLHGAARLYEVYQRADPTYTGRVTVPVLWDKTTGTIVSNESSEIIRMLNESFDTGGPDLWPEALREEIEPINARIYDTLNNGVYKCGFATSQVAYDEAVTALFATLDWLEGHLDGKRYLVGEQLTEADVRLFTTLVRFDPVYHTHFKCSKQRLRDYPNLWAYTRRLYQTTGIGETVQMDAIRRHYFYSHESINPHRIVPIDPEIDFLEPVE